MKVHTTCPKCGAEAQLWMIEDDELDLPGYEKPIYMDHWQCTFTCTKCPYEDTYRSVQFRNINIETAYNTAVLRLEEKKK